MPEFNRGLSKECIAALKRLAQEPGDGWWKEVLANKDLLLAVRGGYLNAYAKGQSIFKIGPKVVDGDPCVQTHYKYLIEPKLERSPYVQFTRKKFLIDPKTVVQTNYKAETLRRMVSAAALFSGPEKKGVHRIAAKEPKVVDLEIAFTRSGEVGEKSTAPRMDLAVLIEGGSGARLVFCEAKCADNVELWKLAEKKVGQDIPPISVVSQIRKYEAFVSDTKHKNALEDAYINVCQTLIELREQGCTRKLDPLIEGVALKQSPLTIHPKVYLLVYGYDSDKRQGALKKRLAELRAILGNRVIAKGNPGSFTLSKDILSLEAAARQ